MIFNFKAGETYTLTMAGRSQRFNVDRILIVSTSNEADKNKSIIKESSFAKKQITLEALNHFTNINTGEIPFYKDIKNNALAINAAIESNRDKFAKASTLHNGATGTYDVTLTTLAEVDGECTYRFLVNGKIMGTYLNFSVKKEDDYQQQMVTFKSINIEHNATIAIEANTHSNGVIPEGTGTAWARGRWRSISLAPLF
jgi:hypothetical protein